MENRKKSIYSSFLIVVMLLICVVSVSFAAYTWNYTSTNANTISTCDVSFTFLESSSTAKNVNIKYPLPMYDSAGKAMTGSGEKFDFEVSRSGSCTGNIGYNITVAKQSVDSGMSALTNGEVKMYLTSLSGTTTKTETQLLAPTLASTIMGATGTSGNLAASQSLTSSVKSKQYRFRMWIDSAVDASNWTATTKKQYKVKLGVATT